MRRLPIQQSRYTAQTDFYPPPWKGKAFEKEQDAISKTTLVGHRWHKIFNE
jgi:hypothetical protein